MRQEAIAATKQTTKSKEDGGEVSDDWTEDQTQLLIKAVNLFPAGTASRYNKDTGFTNSALVYNGNRTEWSPIRSVIILVINKIRRP